MTQARRNRPRAVRGSLCGARAFTIIEVMIVIAIIGLLVSIGTVAASRMRGAAERTASMQFLGALKTGLSQFHEDLQFFPPLLTDRLTIPGRGGPRQEERDMGYYSTLTLVPYLVGVGDLNRDGQDDDDLDDGLAREGFRDPGPDRTWGGAADATKREEYLEARRQSEGGLLRGKSYGPYVELGDEHRFAEATDRRGQVIPKVYQFLDDWGAPIRYYRDWPMDPTQEDRIPKEIIGSFRPDERATGLTSLRSAKYLLYSPGRDGKDDSRDSESRTNQDNLVEIGQ